MEPVKQEPVAASHDEAHRPGAPGSVAEGAVLRRSILRYSAAVLLAVGLLVAAATAWPLYQIMLDKQAESLLAHHRLLALSLQQYEARLEGLAAQVTSRSRIRDELAAYNRGERSREALEAFTRPKLADALDHEEALVGILRLDARGRPAVRAGCRVPAGLGARGIDRVTHLGMEMVGGRPCLLVAAPIVDRQGRRVGTDVAGFRLDGLRALMAAREPPPEAVTTVLAGVQVGGAPAVLARMDATDLTLTDEALLAALLALEPAGRAGLATADLPHRGPVLVTRSRVGDAGWRLYQVHGPEAMYAPVVAPLASVVGLGLLLTLAGLVGLWWLLRPLTGRMLVHTEALDREVREKTAALRAELQERARAEAALRRSEARLEEAQHVARLGSWELEGATRRADASPEACRLLGADPGDAPRSWDELRAHVHAADRAELEAAVADALRSGEPYEVEYRVAAPDGEERVVRERGQPLAPPAGGGAAGLLGTVQDVTAERAAQRERRQLEAELQSAHRLEAIGRLANGIAHDFNNILAGILGYTELALTRYGEQLGPRLRGYLEEIRTAGGRGKELVLQLSTFSRGSSRERREPVRLQEVVPEALRILRPTLPATLDVEVDIPPDLAPALGDAVQVQQALMNLCLNARDAMEGRGRLHISAREAAYHRLPGEALDFESRHWIELRVQDTGPGIAPDQLERIFEPFFSTKEVGKGTGLGLSVVHGIMRAHGGHVLVDSEPGAGTRVRLLFPRVPAGPRLQSLEGEAAPSRSGAERRILVVDDEPPVARYLGEVLALRGYRPRVETDPAAAEAAFAAEPDAFDALVTDQTMPGITGRELVSRLRRLRPHLPVVLCSGHVTLAPPASEPRTLFLPKPVAGEELAGALGELLGPGDPPAAAAGPGAEAGERP